jgi:hypothetical protein
MPPKKPLRKYAEPKSTLSIYLPTATVERLDRLAVARGQGRSATAAGLLIGAILEAERALAPRAH